MTAYEMRISDWSSDVCSSDLYEVGREISVTHQPQGQLRRVSVAVALNQGSKALSQADIAKIENLVKGAIGFDAARGDMVAIGQRPFVKVARSEEHTSELQSLMRISYAVFCLKKKTNKHTD